MNAPRQLLSVLSALLCAAGFSFGAEESKLPTLGGTIKGFTVPARDFLLKGDRAQPGANGRVRIEGVTLETRRGSNELNFLVSSPAGEFDQKSNLVTSSESLVVRSLDQRFFLSGVGFDFRLRTNLLNIHSNVVTRFDRQFFNRTNAAAAAKTRPTTNEAPLAVSSTRLRINGTTGDVTYQRAVKLTDGEALEMTAGEVSFNLSALTNEVRRVIARQDVNLHLKQAGRLGSASADEAVFSTPPGVEAQVELTGHAAWQSEQFSGGAGRLRWQMISNRYDFDGEDGARLRFPLSAFGTNQSALAKTSATNQAQWIDIVSDSHRFAPGRLEFDGKVNARQDTNWSLASRRFEVTLDATNHPTRIDAIGDFIFEINQAELQGRATAGRAQVDNPLAGRQLVTLTESPRWVSPEFEKSADRIEVVDPLGDPVYTGDGHVRLQLAGLRFADFDWFGAKTNQTDGKPTEAQTNAAPVLVTAEHSRFHAGTAVFTGNVMVAQGTNYLSAGELTLMFTPDRRLTNLVAAGGVKIRQGTIVLTARQLTCRFDGVERNVPHVEATGDVRVCGRLEKGAGRGLGARLSYDAASGEAILDGEPEVVVFQAEVDDPKKARPPVLNKAAQIRWNLRAESFRLSSPFSIVTLAADAEIPRACD